MSSARPMAFFDRESGYTGIDAEGGSPVRKLTPAQRRRIKHKTAHVLGRGLHLYEKPAQPAQPEPLRLSADDILRQKTHIRLNEQRAALQAGMLRGHS